MKNVKLQAARSLLINDFPFLAAAALALIPVSRTGLNSVAVDKYYRLYYDEAFIETVSLRELEAILLHEIEHLLRNHFKRLAHYPRKIANIAADLEINDDLDALNLPLPEGALLPREFKFKPHRTAEEYIQMLASTNTDEQNTATQAENTTQSGPAPARGRCGSCATGQREWWEEEENSEVEKVSEEEHEQIRQAVAAIAREIEKNKLPERFAKLVFEEQEHIVGNVSANFERRAQVRAARRRNWKQELEHILVSAATGNFDDYTYSRPSRRQHDNIIFARLISHAARIVIVVDTSASMDDSLLSRALTEVKHILQQLRTSEVYLVAGDTEIKSIQRIHTLDELKSNPLRGGGGTDMGNIIVQCSKLRPDVTLVLTDGETPWPSRRVPGYVVACIINNEKALKGVPKWIKTVQIE